MFILLVPKDRKNEVRVRRSGCCDVALLLSAVGLF